VRTGALEAANRELAAEISQRKVLEDFSKQLIQVIRETPDVVAICAPDGKMQFLNRAGRELFGLAEDAPVLHLDLFSAYPEDMRRWVREEVQPEVVERGIWHGETRFALPGGREIPLSQVLVCKKDADGRVLYLASIARDISDFKQVEQELRQSRERYRTLAEAAHDFIFMVSKDGLMEYANEYACQALGFDPARVEGMPASQFFPKDFAANHLQMFSEVHEIDRPVYTEGPFVRGGEESWLGTWLVPIHNEQGGLVSILGISRDITEQKNTDVALQIALQNERRLGEMRSNFFSMTSHQFRTPLSTILLSAELMQKYGQRWDDQKRIEHLERIQDAAKRLNSMLEDILVIGRVESGRYICAPKDFDLITFIDQAILELTANDRGEHRVVFDHEMEALPVYLDPEVLHRVVDNLLSNALKYSPRGTQITIQVEIEEQYFLIEVSDQGIGIPEQDLKYLFQPFQRGSNAGEYPGTGIGLTIIQKSVELMNGTISLKTKEGQGTTFMVRFPARLVSATDAVMA
jgi:PAS domain S-box-containing protein